MRAATRRDVKERGATHGKTQCHAMPCGPAHFFLSILPLFWILSVVSLSLPLSPLIAGAVRIIVPYHYAPTTIDLTVLCCGRVAWPPHPVAPTIMPKLREKASSGVFFDLPFN